MAKITTTTVTTLSGEASVKSHSALLRRNTLLAHCQIYPDTMVCRSPDSITYPLE